MKSTALRKEAKAHTMGWWKKEAWKVFSRYIRTRDKFKCFTCDLQMTLSTSQAGHMIPRASGGLSLYFHEQNVHCQCYRCNINLGGNGAEYARRYISKYGQDSFNTLINLRDTGYAKFGIPDYQEMIEDYTIKLDKLNAKSNSKLKRVKGEDS